LDGEGHDTGFHTRLERLAVAERVARLHASTAAAAHYRVTQQDTPRLQAMLRHAERLSNRLMLRLGEPHYPPE
jgi:hypothetical protein